MKLDQDKLAEHTLAILSLTMFADGPSWRAWKGMSWDVMDDLFERGWIADPRGKSKSIAFTPTGAELAKTFLQKHFSADSASN